MTKIIHKNSGIQVKKGYSTTKFVDYFISIFYGYYRNIHFGTVTGKPD